ncbi:MAG: hypothetical protein F6K62_17325 [Sphaerospermopsis sp. SIO1G2]|nr:hypothetical protein [Sphaerospermopsis sp. SIO1G1]NET72620.1 hypothetical protein [Sphaerospermopsis sp. SIO1G2]
MKKMNKSYATKQLLAGYFGIIMGGLGLHKFILGYAPEGFIMLVISIVGGSLTYGFTLILMQLIGLIEGMIYLNKNHEEFVQTYFVNKQGWF